MQLEWRGRPDALRPHGYVSLLDYYCQKRREWEEAHGRVPLASRTRIVPS